MVVLSILTFFSALSATEVLSNTENQETASSGDAAEITTEVSSGDAEEAETTEENLDQTTEIDVVEAEVVEVPDEVVAEEVVEEEPSTTEDLQGMETTEAGALKDWK